MFCQQTLVMHGPTYHATCLAERVCSLLVLYSTKDEELRSRGRRWLVVEQRRRRWAQWSIGHCWQLADIERHLSLFVSTTVLPVLCSSKVEEMRETRQATTA
eukprot:GHVS01061718.1.p2 GENE.GHVS01061718.1~~GHVS01061718.1.p2  ORF type:complete len:102 (-),score=14.09 GHVS01061718.1:124-429(-)